MLVEVIAKKSQNKPWEISLYNKKYSQKNIRRVSIDKFYEIVTNNEFAFYKLCNFLQIVIDKITKDIENSNHPITENTVLKELKSTNYKYLLEALYNLAFSTYNGWRKNK